MRRCTTHGRRICTWCVLQSIGFPVEHFLWEKLWPLRLVTVWLGV